MDFFLFLPSCGSAEYIIQHVQFKKGLLLNPVTELPFIYQGAVNAVFWPKGLSTLKLDTRGWPVLADWGSQGSAKWLINCDADVQAQAAVQALGRSHLAGS